MTLYLERKCAGCCPRCGAPSSETSVLSANKIGPTSVPCDECAKNHFIPPPGASIYWITVGEVHVRVCEQHRRMLVTRLQELDQPLG